MYLLSHSLCRNLVRFTDIRPDRFLCRIKFFIWLHLSVVAKSIEEAEVYFHSDFCFAAIQYKNSVSFNLSEMLEDPLSFLVSYLPSSQNTILAHLNKMCLVWAFVITPSLLCCVDHICQIISLYNIALWKIASFMKSQSFEILHEAVSSRPVLNFFKLCPLGHF